MRKKILFMLVALLGILPCMGALSIQKTYVRFKEYRQRGYNPVSIPKMPLKSSSSSNRRGNITLLFDSNVPDSIKTSLQRAKEIWENKIQNQKEIFIRIEYAPLPDNLVLQADIGYCNETKYFGAPTALVSQMKEVPFGSIDSPDGIIVLNSNVNWNCSFTSDKSPGYNAYTAGLRGIAITLGFGSSIYRDSKGAYDFILGSPSTFDYRVHDKDRTLAQVNKNDLGKFITSNSLYVAGENNDYKLYSPRTYEDGLSLKYIDQPLSLMHYKLGEGNKFFSIDSSTIDILNGIGWGLIDDSGTFSIKCDDIGDNGIGSSNTRHRFSLDVPKGTAVSRYSWIFWLRKKDGSLTAVSKSYAPSFTISEVSNPEEYYANTDGDLEGKVTCDYMVGGKTHEAVPFALSLEQKPIIISVDDIEIINVGSYYFSVSCNVKYAGSDKIKVEFEEEDSPYLHTYSVKEPFIAHVAFGNMSRLVYNWMIITVGNKYGSVSKTVEFAPTYNTSDLNMSASVESSDAYSTDDKVRVYSMQGRLVYEGERGLFNVESLSSGTYMVVCADGDNMTKTQKIYVP